MKNALWIVVAIVALTACGAEEDTIEPDEDLALDPPGGKTDVDVSSLPSGADLFINSCRPANGSLVCSPWRMRISPGGTTVTTPLPEVTQPLTHERPTPGLIAIPGLVGSTVDQAHRKVYWHADCDAGYHVTDIDTGVTETFALDLAALGIEDDGHGFCLGEWVFDESRRVAIAIGGHQNRDGGVNSEKSNIEYALAIDATGGVSIMHDLRGTLDPRFRFLHEFQTIASLDPDRDEIIAPLMLPPAAENQMVLNLTTGAVRILDGGGARVHRFFDVVTRSQTALDCNANGLTSTLTGLDGAPRVAIPQDQLDAEGINTCIPGFTGGGHDPVGTKAFLLMRSQDMPAAGMFLLGVADLSTDRWLGFAHTDATYGALGMDFVDADQRLFLSTELVPAIEGPDGGSSITVTENQERRFRTAALPPGTYRFSITGIGDADLHVRAGSSPTTTVFDCRPALADSNESCRITLASTTPIHVMVRGFADTSTVHLSAVAE